MRARIAIGLMELFVVFGLSTVAEAGFVSFTGKVTGILNDDALLPSGLVSTSGPLSEFVVNFLYDETAFGPGFIGGASEYVFSPPPAGHSFSAIVGSLSLFTDPFGFIIDVEDDGPLGDRFDIFGSMIIPSVLAANGVETLRLEFELLDSTGNAFSSDALPAAFTFSEFDSIKLTVRGDAEGPFFIIEGGPLDAAVAPEPGSLTLMSLGSLSFLGWMRRRER